MRVEMERTGRWSGEVWQRRKDGTEFLCWLQASIVLDASGRFQKALALPGAASFITEIAVDAGGTVVALDSISRRLHASAKDAGAFSPLGGVQVRVDGQRRLQHGADLLARIQRAVGILEHQLHRLPQPSALRRRRVHRIRAVQD